MKKQDKDDTHKSEVTINSFDELAYPLYKPDDDIYVHGIEVSTVDPDDITLPKLPNPDTLEYPLYGSDLDIPIADVDDAEEAIGNEDEENNYYSLGGDDKSSLDEN